VDARVDEAFRATVLYRSLSSEDRARLADVSALRSYDKGEALFSEGDASDFLHTIVKGRAKVVKLLPSGKEVILEIFGPGDPIGAVVAYEGRPYPATALALEPTSCLLVKRAAFFALLERHPSLVRSFILGLTQRIVELTRRIPEVAGGRVETRFARLFLKLAAKMGAARSDGTFIPLPLTRQDLADLTGTTIETGIRIMSRWGREGIVRTERDGFLLLDHRALEKLSEE
jgi:CRP/FNR family transcriptional regulator